MNDTQPVVVTEPAAVAALKDIYQNNGPGGLEWDFSVPGQVTANDGSLTANDGALTELDLEADLDVLLAGRRENPGLRFADLREKFGLKGVLKLHHVRTLRGLRADDNALCGLDLHDLPELEWLSLNENGKIGDLSSLAGLPKLARLELRGNAIGDVSPLAGLTELTDLALSGNAIGDVSPLAGLAKLDRLELALCAIRDLSPLAGLTGLTDLDLWGNEIRGLRPLAGLTKLTGLDLSENEIRDVSPLAGLTELIHLDLWGNEIGGVSPLAELPKLASLDLRENPIGDVSSLGGLLTAGSLCSAGIDYERTRDKRSGLKRS
jgi:Leucine-rich repeat (LRR) protein